MGKKQQEFNLRRFDARGRKFGSALAPCSLLAQPALRLQPNSLERGHLLHLPAQGFEKQHRRPLLPIRYTCTINLRESRNCAWTAREGAFQTEHPVTNTTRTSAVYDQETHVDHCSCMFAAQVQTIGLRLVRAQSAPWFNVLLDSRAGKQPESPQTARYAKTLMQYSFK
jgi:hypothetical protein